MKKSISEIVNIILRTIIIILIILKIWRADYDGISILILTFTLTFYNIILKNLLKIDLKEYTKVILSIFIFFALCLGSVMKFYNIFPWWDLFLHCTSGVMTYFIGKEIIFNIISKDKKVQLNYIIISIFAICFSLAIGNAWEILEFTIDGILGKDTQIAANFIGRNALMDTMTDLIASTTGTILTYIVITFIHKKNNK